MSKKKTFVPTGLDTEIPKGMILNARTIAILYALEKKGVVYVQFDDGPLDYETIKQLKEIAFNVGYDLCWQSQPHSAFLIDSNQVTEV